MGIAFPPVRIAELVESFGDDGVLGSCCLDDYSDTMSEVVAAIQRHLGTGCVDIPAGVDPAIDCRLLETLDDDSEREVPATDWVVTILAMAVPPGSSAWRTAPRRRSALSSNAPSTGDLRFRSPRANPWR